MSLDLHVLVMDATEQLLVLVVHLWYSAERFVDHVHAVIVVAISMQMDVCVVHLAHMQIVKVKVVVQLVRPDDMV